MANPVWEVLQPLTTWGMVRANQNATPPAKPYSTYRLTTITPLTVIETEPDTAGSRKLYAPMLLRCEINFFGPGSEAQARRMHMALHTLASHTRMQANGLALARIVGITDASGIVEDVQSQERSILEITMNATDATDEIVGVIEHVSITPDPEVEPGNEAGWNTGCEGTITSPTATTQPPE